MLLTSMLSREHLGWGLGVGWSLCFDMITIKDFVNITLQILIQVHGDVTTKVKKLKKTNTHS